MYNQPETALEKYGINLTKISRGRGYYLCDTSIGQKVLCPYGRTEESAARQDGLLKYLKEQGIPCEQIIATDSGQILSADNLEAHYILKDFFPQKECETDDVKSVCECMKAIAKMHKAIISYPKASQYDKEDDLIERLTKKRNELKHLSSYIRKKSNLNDFERMYINNYRYYMIQANQAIECIEKLLQTGIEKQLCHMSLNQHNIVNYNGQWVIINYEKAALSYPQVDVAEFGRKILEKSNWSYLTGDRIINAYEEENEFTDNQKMLLGALFLFPEKICKIVNQYSMSRKNTITQQKKDKLEKVIRQEDARRLFLKKEFSIEF